MVNYLSQLYNTSRQMSKAVRGTFMILCVLPSLVLAPLVLFLARESSDVVSEVQLFTFAKSLIAPSQASELAQLGEQVFAPSPELMHLVYAVIATSIAGAAFMALLLAPVIVDGINKARGMRRAATTT